MTLRCHIDCVNRLGFYFTKKRVKYNSMNQQVSFITHDRVELAGIYRNTDQKKIAVLLHMMPATKESWDSIAHKLLERGYASLAFDQNATVWATART